MIFFIDLLIAPTSFIQTAERSVAADFVTPLIFSYKSVFIKNPANVYNFTAYLEPLTYLSWTFIGLFFLLVPYCLHMISKLSREKMPIIQSFEAIFMSLLLLGSPNDPSKISTRIAFLR